MKKIYFLSGILFLFSASGLVAQRENNLVVQVNKVIAPVQPTMWGIFFEDINMGADGGIYAELVKNRSFEFYKPMMGWTVGGKKLREGDVLVVNRKEINEANKRYIRVTVNQAAQGDLYMINEGFRGMGIKKNLRYYFSCMYKQAAGVKMHIALVDSTGAKLSDEIVLTPKADGTGLDKGFHQFYSQYHRIKRETNDLV